MGLKVDLTAAAKKAAIKIFDQQKDKIVKLIIPSQLQVGINHIDYQNDIILYGNVGMGTESPDANVHVQSSGDASIWLQADTSQDTPWGGSEGEDSNAWIKFSQDGAVVQAILGTCGNQDRDPENNTFTYALANATLLGVRGGGDLYSLGALQFGTNSSVRMTIDYYGRVGIGTNDPSTGFEVGGAGRAFFGNNTGANSSTKQGLLIDGNEGSGTYTRIESYDYDASAGLPLYINTTGAGSVKIGGVLTNATQPAFAAYLGTAQTNIPEDTWTVVEFNGEVYDIGGDFNTTTYIFTAPVDGKYFLHTNIRIDAIPQDDDQYTWGSIVTTARSWYGGLFAIEVDETTSYWTSAVTAIADMDAGDTAKVKVKIRKSSTADINSSFLDADDIDCGFYGYLLG